MEKSGFSLTVAFLLFIITTQSTATPFLNSTTDQYALLTFKNSITADPRAILTKNWSTNTSICSWIGVTCTTQDHRVAALNLSAFGLGGTLPPHVGNLTFLQSLDISFNTFMGLPTELSKLPRLKYINMEANSFVGEIPPWFGDLSELQHLQLKNNKFSGGIPPALFNISGLQTLDLAYNDIDGNIPQEIGKFSSLNVLNLADNQLSGSIPNGIFNISSLVEIDLSYNRLSGELPDEMCSNNSPKLRRIYLSYNQISGDIPANILRCRELDDLRLISNHFSGNIPTQIGNLTMLRTLILSSNQFQGDLPQEIGNLAVLEYFSVGKNSLSGFIPSSIFNISSLKALFLEYNHFSGSLPSNTGLSLLSLQLLHIESNEFSGEIPSSITNASKLTRLSLHTNSFSGFVPNLGGLRLLQRLMLFTNNLSGLGFLSSLTSCRNLERLGITENPLNDILPPSIGNLSSFLRTFRAQRCGIRGVIPTQIGNLSSLIHIYMGENKINGSIPTTIGKLKKLQRIYLGGNQLQGHIPTSLCEMPNLGEFGFSENMLIGPIPSCLGELKSLRKVYLDSNKFNSPIPSNFWNLKDLLVLNLASNYLNGQISPQIGNLKVANQIYLSYNLLSGDIPSSIDGCESLEFLSLSNNKFGGSIPQSLGEIRGLTGLDLSHNNFSGFIPKSLQDLRFLQFLNVSYNKLEGEIPSEGCFVNFTSQSFLHNSDLCGATKFEVKLCSRSRSNHVQLVKYIAPPLGLAILFVIIVLMLVRRRRREKVVLQNNDISLGFGYRRISYRELEKGTNSFSETNLLGRGSFGSVYKVTLVDGEDAAVKVYNFQSNRVAKSFETESKLLSTLRHRNLVRVIGCCSNTEFKGLVLEYMPNGSLDKLLHPNSYCLDLVKRLEIAIDVALALEHLHHGHAFPIAHCDVKSSNVLLDRDMTACLGDFGIAKLFNEGEAFIQTQTLGTIGYAAPEYGLEGNASTKGDVYSYGILLLEMITMKRPTDDMFRAGMSLKEWVSQALCGNATAEVTSPGLLSKEDQYLEEKEKCVSLVFQLAMKCLTVSPSERINMIEATASLKKIKATFVAAHGKSDIQFVRSTKRINKRQE